MLSIKATFGTAVLTLVVGFFYAGHAWALPTLSFSAVPSTVKAGEQVVLNWFVSDDRYFCAGSGGWGGYYGPFGSATVLPKASQTYFISCTGPLGTITSRADVSLSGSSVSSSPVSTAPSFSSRFSASCAVGPSSQVGVGERVTFAAASTGGRAPVSFEWRGAASGVGPLISTSFSSPGFKSATLTARDADQKTVEIGCGVTVAGVTPVSTASAPRPASKPTVSLAKLDEAGIEALCLDAGFMKPAQVELARGEDGAKKTQAASPLFSVKGLPAGLSFFLLTIAILLSAALAAFFTLRYIKKNLKEGN